MDINSSQNIEIHIPGLEIAAKTWGPEDGKPVLSAHGWLDNAATFDRLAPMLDGLRIVAFDFPGHGRSDHRPPGVTYHFIDWVPIFFDVADALGWQTFSLMCHSMGAAAASLAAGTYPERIERMVLIDGLGPWASPASEAPGQLRKALDERKVLSEKSSRVFNSPEDAVNTVSEVHGLSPANAKLLVDRGLEQLDDGQWRFTYDLFLRGASNLRLTEEQVLAFFGEIECPSLLIRPRSGWPTDAAHMQRRIDAIATLEVFEVEGGHHVHLENPERIVDAVGEFLNPH
ncbi:alpha/beta hydrolase [Persicimonas caeni]|uniref:Alpha/beta hydrolase n=1 Tax=Persicimonas caeni TaxID=2292766 RepID=A0A4Y6PWX6_PERCE|nr:alpha/beta hydrolase [Persicimonas caeni]QDG52828.1 alpha/beta hydrolase [Persicimonas caeni]QED34050.1 alpha/beta hydrolase [Persicimonas caeni]